MLRTMMTSKIHRATATQADLHLGNDHVHAPEGSGPLSGAA
jgi:hypothetical protein